jgi:hypothetical protein
LPPLPRQKVGRGKLEIETRADCGLIAFITVGRAAAAGIIVEVADHRSERHARPERVADAELNLVERVA